MEFALGALAKKSGSPVHHIYKGSSTSPRIVRNAGLTSGRPLFPGERGHTSRQQEVRMKTMRNTAQRKEFLSFAGHHKSAPLNGLKFSRQLKLTSRLHSPLIRKSPSNTTTSSKRSIKTTPLEKWKPNLKCFETGRPLHCKSCSSKLTDKYFSLSMNKAVKAKVCWPNTYLRATKHGLVKVNRFTIYTNLT